jgi:hypothetical protein
MSTLQAAIRLVGFALLFGAAGLIALGMLRGTINCRGLLSHKTPHGLGRVSAERVQLLVLTLVVAAKYLADAVASAEVGRLPALPVVWLAALGASHGVYLGGKALASREH